ncbi:MAG: hypothetical protein HXX17_07940 [Geobacteraceae bacterium]|nr:hypothetical protein [Geobacteraceae bacterium]
MSNETSPRFVSIDANKSDTVDLPTGQCRALYVGSGGTLVIGFAGGGAGVTFSNVQNGSVIPAAAARLFNTGTTCTGVIALY